MSKFMQYIKAQKSFSAAIGILVCGAVYAASTTYGPFFVAALGKAYMNITFSQDQEMEFAVANKLAGVYMSPILNTPAKIANAIDHALVRIVYADGIISDFTLTAWPSTLPLTFKQNVASDSSPDMSMADRADAIDSAPCGALSVSVDTGFWGEYWPDDGSLGTTAFWVDLGPEEISTGSGLRGCR